MRPIAPQGSSFAPVSRSFASVTTNQTGADFVVVGPWIFVETGSTRAVAVNAVTLVTGPFRVIDDFNLSSDRHTRVTIITSNLGAVTTSGLQVYAGPTLLQVESVRTTIVQGMEASCIIVRLPDGLAPGDWPLQVVTNGINSRNNPTLSIAANHSAWNWFFTARVSSFNS